MLRKFTGAALALMLVAVSASACKKGEAAAQQKTAETEKPQPPKPVPQTLPDVIARVNGEAVTKAEFEKYIAQLEMNAGQPVPPDRRDEIYRTAIDRLVDIRVLTHEVKTRGLTGDEKTVEEQMQRIRSQFPSEEEYKKALSARGTTPEQLRADMLNETRINQLLQAETAKMAAVTDEDVKKFYDENPKEFAQAEQVRASHILFKTEGATDAQKKQARTKATQVLKEARSGKDFAALAKQHSSDGSAAQGGDLGFFVKERMVPAFSNAAFALKPGEISDLVESEFGFHIIKLTERKAASTVPLQDVAPQVKNFLTEKKQQDTAEAFVKQLRTKARVEVLV